MTNTKTDTSSSNTKSDSLDVLAGAWEQVNEGMRDGATAGFAETAARLLAKQLVKMGAPETMVNGKAFLAILTFIAPLLVLVLVQVGGEKVPKAEGLRSLAMRAIRGAATHMAADVVGGLSGWLGDLVAEFLPELRHLGVRR